MSIGARLCNLRLENKMSMSEAAGKFGVQKTTVFRWEHDKFIPEKTRLVELADFYGVSVDWILKGVETEENELERRLNIPNRYDLATMRPHVPEYDEMTGVYNKKSGLNMLDELIETGARWKFVSTVCFFDINRLKYVNYTFGRIEGDRILKKIANIIAATIRDTDILARLGGAEFMIALRSCTLENASIVVKKISDRFSEAENAGEFPYNPSFNVGLEEVTPDKNYEAAVVIKNAVQKLYA